eukprot:scaffold63774_cov15-Tisochrysis_lutea.AAC.1
MSRKRACELLVPAPCHLSLCLSCCISTQLFQGSHFYNNSPDHKSIDTKGPQRFKDMGRLRLQNRQDLLSCFAACEPAELMTA